MKPWSNISVVNMWRAAALLLLLSSSWGLYELLQPPFQAGILFLSRRWLAVLTLGLAGLVFQAALLIASWTAFNRRLAAWLACGLSKLERLGAFNLVLFGLMVAGYAFTLLGPFGSRFASLPVRLPLFMLTVLLGTLLLRAFQPQHSWSFLAAGALLFAATGYRMATFLPDITNYPFTLGWSEASRYYYASLYLDRSVYGQDVLPTVLHPSRYLMQAVPFLIRGLPIGVHRAWQIFLWLATTFGSAYLFARRLDRQDGCRGSGMRMHMLAGWAFLFLILGPVYYHLLVPLMLMLWGFRSERFWRSLGVVLLASVWAGISRVNWIPVPGMLAAALYLLEVPVGKTRTSSLLVLLRYFLPPAAWGFFGVLAAFGSQALYVYLSGNQAEQFASSLTSDLLWYRLWPNPTFPLGILPGTLLISLPPLLLVLARLAGRWRDYHPLRHLALAAMLSVLFAGGLVVSVKIGGGSNLHNVDAYAAFLLVVAGWIVYGRYVPEPQEAGVMAEDSAAGIPARPVVLAAAILIVVYFAFELGSPLVTLQPDEVESALEIVRSETQQAAAAGGEVLFIAQRQLLTFGYITGVPLVPEHERVFLMEMAMSGNREYLDAFHADLRNHRYAVIISEPLFRQEKDETQIFGEENNAWVSEVSNHVLCYYQTHKLRRLARIQVMIPRTEPPKDMVCP